jgi:PAS domain S-box-containing protein
LLLPMAISLAAFVCSIGPYRQWLLLGAIGTRAVATVANFTTGDTLVYSSITTLHDIVLWGDRTIVVPIGVSNPWAAFGQISNLMLVGLVADQIIALYRQPRSERRARSLRISASVLVFLASAAAWTLAVVAFALPLPLMATPFILAIMLVMSWDVGSELLRSAQLAQTLQSTESALRNSRDDLTLAENVAGLGLWNWERASGRLSLTAPAARMLGLADGEPVDLERICALVEPADLVMARQAVAAAIETGARDLSLECRMAYPMHSPRWIAVHSVLDVDPSGNVESAHGLIVDVTIHRNADEQFQLVLRSSPVAIVLVDSDGRLLLSNQSAARVTGYSVEELAGKKIDCLLSEPLRELHHGDTGRWTEPHGQRLVMQPREVALRRKDGSLAPAEISLNPIQTNGRELVIAGINDVSERHAREREIAAQRDALAHLSRISLLSELSGSLAHELNQPLAAILANAQAAIRFLDREQPDLAEVREGLARIIASDKHAGEVIRRLRAMLRKEPPDFIALDVNGLVHDSLRIVRSDLIDRNIEICEDLAAGLPEVLGDRVQLQQVLLNLIMNAAEAMNETDRARRITLRTRTQGDGVLLQVEDVGHGIPADDLERIFAPFVSSKPNGLGFGLSLCTTLIEAHGGRLRASSDPGHGATLHVWLPSAGASPISRR